MLIVAGEVRAAKDQIESMFPALVTMVEATLKEEGCISYRFSVDIADPNCLQIFERWKSAEALEEHFHSAHMAAFGAALGSVKLESMEVKAYEVAREVDLPS